MFDIQMGPETHHLPDSPGAAKDPTTTPHATGHGSVVVVGRPSLEKLTGGLGHATYRGTM